MSELLTGKVAFLATAVSDSSVSGMVVWAAYAGELERKLAEMRAIAESAITLLENESGPLWLDTTPEWKEKVESLRKAMKGNR